jgi:hypothetical protein
MQRQGALTVVTRLNSLVVVLVTWLAHTSKVRQNKPQETTEPATGTHKASSEGLMDNGD